MSEINIKNKMINATKWASVTEIIAKLILPITNIFLARILAPEAFGVVATISMIVSFADIFTDAGFQKYIVQQEFDTEKEKIKCINVAFWSNLMVSIILWLCMIIFKDNLAIWIGSPELGNVIAVSGLQLVLTSFSSIQMAVYRREFDFKTLFLVRIIGISTPFFVTIPLALLGWSYWALIVGNIFGLAVNAIILTIKSTWKPGFYYSFNLLKKMLSFSIWTLAESVSIWLSSWIDTFIIGNYFNSYYVGLYKTSLNTVNSLTSIITGATTPVLFSSLSRLQDRDEEFKKIYYNMQKIVAYLIFPIGLGGYLYQDIITYILLGKDWIEASPIIGMWSVISVIKIIFGNYCSELYRAKGKPKISFSVQCLFLLIFIPICIISAKYGFKILVVTITFGRLIIIIIHNIVTRIVFKMKFIDTLKNIFTPLICTLIMGILGIIMKKYFIDFSLQLLSILICAIFYLFLIVFIGKKDLKILQEF